MYPFRSKVWIKLFILYVFAGGCSSSYLWRLPATVPTVLAQSRGTSSDPSTEKSFEQIKKIIRELVASNPDIRPRLEMLFSQVRENWPLVRNVVLSFVGLMVFLLFLLWVVHTWVKSRMQPVIVLSALRKEPHFSGYWSETATLGNDLFWKNFWGSLLIWLPWLLFLAGTITAFFKYRLWLLSHWYAPVLAILLCTFVTVLVGIGLAILNAFYPSYTLQSTKTPKESFSFLVEWTRAHPKESFVGLLLYWVFVIILSAFTTTLSLFILGPTMGLGGVAVGLAFVAVKASTFAVQIIVMALVGFALLSVFILLTAIIVVTSQTFLVYVRIELTRQLLLKESALPTGRQAEINNTEILS